MMPIKNLPPAQLLLLAAQSVRQKPLSRGFEDFLGRHRWQQQRSLVRLFPFSHLFLPCHPFHPWQVQVFWESCEVGVYASVSQGPVAFLTYQLASQVWDLAQQ
uniref:Uncharacterized protein n=1 Tax=Opuntia streptacantha TaxID=393608 RepID=A0A7C9D6J3_OPUST